MSAHRLLLLVDRRSEDRAEVEMQCNACPLTVALTVKPGEQADHLVATLTDAHRYTAIEEPSDRHVSVEEL